MSDPSDHLVGCVYDIKKLLGVNAFEFALDFA